MVTRHALKTVVSTLLLALLVATLVACDSGQQGEKTDTTESASASVTETEASDAASEGSDKASESESITGAFMGEADTFA